MAPISASEQVPTHPGDDKDVQTQPTRKAEKRGTQAHASFLPTKQRPQGVKHVTIACRGVRGATTVDANTREEVLRRTREMLALMIRLNGMRPDEVAAALFTTTTDVNSEFPAFAARQLGWLDAALMCGHEMAVPGALGMCIRVLVFWNTDRPSSDLHHVYVRGASHLRPDKASLPPVDWDSLNGWIERQLQNWRERRQAQNQALLPASAPAPLTTLNDVTRALAQLPAAKTPQFDTQIYVNQQEGAAVNSDNTDAGDSTFPATTAPPGAASQTAAAGWRVAFQGEHGAYSEQATRQHFSEQVQTMPCHTFEDIFGLVEKGGADFGVAPVENSVAGSINKTYDLLLERDLTVVGEILLRVRHNLLSLPGTGMADIQQVRSHPQALAQCERYLNQHGWRAIPWYDTAGSAKELAQNPEPGVAVIASALAARTYGLVVLEERIEDLLWNFTRFFVVAQRGAAIPAPPATDEPFKTSLVFATPHTPGALHGCLGEFASRGINLAKLESRPRRNRPWHYVFYLDFEGDWRQAACQEALVGLLARAAFVKLLGSYPAARMPEMNAMAQDAVLQI
jgi:prephenate dehydratase